MNRLRGLAGLAGLLGLGALVAGFAAPLPEPVRVLAALTLLLVLPAGLLAGVMERAGLLPAQGMLRYAAGVLAWLCALAIWTTVFAAAGAPFRVYAIATIWTMLAGFAAAAVAQLRRSMPVTISRSTGAAALVLCGCALFAALYPPVMSVGEDSLDHAGYVRHILTDNHLEPDGVLALAADETDAPPDPRKGALHPVFALASWISSSEPAATWRWLTVVMFPAAAVALLAFNGAFLASRVARAGAATLVLLTFDGNPFRFAAASPHGVNLAAMWAWVLTAMAVSRAFAPARWYVWTFLAAGGVLAHLGVAWHVLVLAATVALFGGAWGLAAPARWRRAMAMLAGVVVALAARHDDIGGATNIIHAHVQGVMFVSDRLFVASPMEILRQQGMIFLGGVACVPVLAMMARAHAPSRAILAVSAIPLAVSFVPWLATWAHEHGTYMVFRSLLQVPAFAAIVVTAGALAAGIRRRSPRALFLGIPAAALWLVVFAGPVPAALVNDLRSAPGGRRASAGVSPDLLRAVSALPSDAVVLTDPATAYALSAHTPQRFVAVYEQHGNPRDPHALERLRAVRDVLSPFVQADFAAIACRRFDVDYVLVNSAPPADAAHFLSVWDPVLTPLAVQRLQSFGASFMPMNSPAGAWLFRIERGAVINRSWSTSELPIATASPPLDSCFVQSPSYAFQITGVGVEPASVLPGDTLQVTLGYYRDTASRFDFPVQIHLRFDHEVIGRGPEFPGEKQWRRFADRRAGVLSRFRIDVRPGHGVYEPDLWPTGFELCETFRIVVPPAARAGEYRIEVSMVRETQVPNFHVRDLLYNRDHYSGTACTTLSVSDRLITETEP